MNRLLGLFGYKLIKIEYPKLIKRELWADSLNVFRIGDKIKNLDNGSVGIITSFGRSGYVVFKTDTLTLSAHVSRCAKLPNRPCRVIKSR